MHYCQHGTIGDVANGKKESLPILSVRTIQWFNFRALVLRSVVRITTSARISLVSEEIRHLSVIPDVGITTCDFIERKDSDTAR